MDIFREYSEYDALGLAELVRKKQVSAQELYHTARNRLEQINPVINAVVTPMYESAEKLSSHVDRSKIFCGVPFLSKDLKLEYAGYPMTNGSRAMQNYIPDRNAQLVDVFNSAGLVSFGKTNTSELGAASLTNNALFGATLNPWDTARNSGGSSGGSSAAVAARVVPMAYASDGGGSIRMPASYCGIFGFKPSRNINKYEDMSKAWGGAVVSHVSTISVRDSAAYLDLVTDHYHQDFEFVAPPQGSYFYAVSEKPKKLSVGMITDSPIGTRVDDNCIDAVLQTAKDCEQLGHNVEEINWNIDGMALMRAFLTVVFCYTHRDVKNMASLTGVTVDALDLKLDTRFMSMLGSTVTSQMLDKSLAVWSEAAGKMTELHKKYDVILTPAVATTPLQSDALDPNLLEHFLMKVLIKTKAGKYIFNDKLLDSIIHKSIYQTPFTPIANITGQPAMSVPLFWAKDGLPYGSHFMAAEGNDRLLFCLAAQLEALRSWQNRSPDIAVI